MPKFKENEKLMSILILFIIQNRDLKVCHIYIHTHTYSSVHMHNANLLFPQYYQPKSTSKMVLVLPILISEEKGNSTMQLA